MSNDLEKRPEASVMSLVSGIITDVHKLTKQQLALFRHEIDGEISHIREAGSLVAAGLAVAMIGCILLCEMLVRLLASIATGFPLWGCYGLVGAPFAIIGVVLCVHGIQKFNNINTAAVELAYDRKEKLNG